MKKIAMAVGIIGGLVPLVWALTISLDISNVGPRWITSVIVGVVAIILSFLLGISPKVVGAILAVLGIVGLIYFIPTFTWTGVILIVAGILAFFVKNEGKATPAA